MKPESNAATGGHAPLLEGRRRHHHRHRLSRKRWADAWSERITDGLSRHRGILLALLAAAGLLLLLLWLFQLADQAAIRQYAGGELSP